jgi:SAM-dependent methyltransferase
MTRLLRRWNEARRAWVGRHSAQAEALALARALARSSDGGRPFRILEIGPGEGKVLRAIDAEFAPLEITLVDYAPRWLKELSAALRNPSRAVQLDLFQLMRPASEGGYPGTRLPVGDESQDLVILTEVIEHLTVPQLVVAEVGRVLRPGGTLVVTTPNVHSLGNRLAMLLGVKKLFVRGGAEGFAFDIDNEPYGHVAFFTHATLRHFLEQLGFRVRKALGAGFGVPPAGYAAPWFARAFPTLADHVVLELERVSHEPLAYASCPLNEAPRLLLPGRRCICPQLHHAICRACEYAHEDFLHPRDPRRGLLGRPGAGR